MQPRGWREVERAKADGRWDAAYASYSTIEPPKDLMAAIGAVPAAYVRWEVLMKRERYEILLRLTCLRTEDGRMKNIARTVERLTRGEALHPQQKGRGVKRAGGLMDAKPVKRAKRRGEEESGAGSRASPVPDALMKKTGRRSERIAVRDSTT